METLSLTHPKGHRQHGPYPSALVLAAGSKLSEISMNIKLVDVSARL